MKTVGFSGVRGGVGTTSMTAMVSDALHRAGHSVMMIDLNASDALRLHFDVAYENKRGWAFAQQLEEQWNQHIIHLADRLQLLPFGRNGAPERAKLCIFEDLAWLRGISDLSTRPDWVLLDMPVNFLPNSIVSPMLDLNLLITSVDMGCHVLLTQYDFHPGTRLLVNLQDPSRVLCHDLLLEWSEQYADRLVPAVVDRDESVHEALALKSPVTQSFPNSSAAQQAQVIATWLNAYQGD